MSLQQKHSDIPAPQLFTVILVVKTAHLRKKSSSSGKDKVNVLTVLQSVTNLPRWDFPRATGVIIAESISMNSFVHLGHRFYAARESLGQLLALVCDADRILTELCCIVGSESRHSGNPENTAKPLCLSSFTEGSELKKTLCYACLWELYDKSLFKELS